MLPHEILWIPLAPFLGAGALALVGRRLSERGIALVACAACFLSCLAAVAAMRTLLAGPSFLESSWGTWIPAGDASADFAFRVDPLSCVMALVVSGVGFLIHVYSVGTLRGDAGFLRYFTYLNLFVGAMQVLVTASNLPLLFLGWEGVGLCSYLLIGFWYESEEKAAAGLKAFLVNKVADVCFLAGMLLLAVLFGTFDLPSLHTRVLVGDLPDPWLVRLSGLLLFVGACGKSAQIVFHIWLPDAMAGPTPVSALIHAATMVTAGVYLVARLHFLYLLDPALLDLVAAVGAVTALYGAAVALVQTDIKKVLAYSTISQLGFLFLGLGSGAFAASLFHLVTHAFFKALLFLSAGSVLHALGGLQDIRRMGTGLWLRLPATFTLATVGVLSATTFPLAGFMSKHQILDAASSTRPLFGWLAQAASLLTALYLARWWVLVFLVRADREGAGVAHPHESPPVMTVPMAILAAGACLGGLLGRPLGAFLAFHYPFPSPEALAHGGDLLFASLFFPAAAAAFAWIYKRGLPRRFEASSPGRTLLEAAQSGFYLDALYRDCVVAPLKSGAVLLWAVVDLLAIDGCIHALASGACAAGDSLRRLQTGLVGTGLWMALAGSAAVLAWAAWGGR